MVVNQNGKKTEFRFQGTLLVPVEKLNGKCSFFWAGTLTSSDNRVDIIVFKANRKEDFVPLMEKDLEVLKEMEQTDGIKSQVAFIEKTLREVGDSLFVKTPEQPMLDAAQNLVSQVLRRNGDYMPVRFSKDNTIYTSGVVAACPV